MKHTHAIAQAGVFLEPGKVTEAVLHAGDAGFAPRGSGHYFINTADEDAYVILIFDEGKFTNIDVTSLIAGVPPQARAPSLIGTFFCSEDHIACTSTHGAPAAAVNGSLCGSQLDGGMHATCRVALPEACWLDDDR